MPVLQKTVRIAPTPATTFGSEIVHSSTTTNTQQLAPKMVDTAFWSSSDGSSDEEEEEEEGRASGEQVSTMAAFPKATTAKASIGADVKQNYLSVY